MSGRIHRSAAHEWMTGRGWDHARQAGVTTVVDLRNEMELGRTTEHPVLDSGATAGITFVHAPTEDPHDAEFVRRCGPWLDHPCSWTTNLQMYPQKIVRVLDAVARATSPVLIHCAGGRDRTGMIGSFLLLLAGAAPESIVANYESGFRGAAEHRGHGWSFDQVAGEWVSSADEVWTEGELDAALDDRRPALLELGRDLRCTVLPDRGRSRRGRQTSARAAARRLAGCVPIGDTGYRIWRDPGASARDASSLRERRSRARWCWRSARPHGRRPHRDPEPPPALLAKAFASRPPTTAGGRAEQRDEARSHSNAETLASGRSSTSVVDAHQSGSGQQRLACRAHTQLCGRSAPRRELLSPPLKVTIKVAVETASGTRVRRKRREPGGWIRPDKVDAVVTEEHLVPVRRVRVAVVVGRSSVGDLNASTPVRIGGRQASRQRVRAVQVDGQQIDVGRPATRIARSHRP